jgi:hypothetical protein
MHWYATECQATGIYLVKPGAEDVSRASISEYISTAVAGRPARWVCRCRVILFSFLMKIYLMVTHSLARLGGSAWSGMNISGDEPEPKMFGKTLSCLWR